MVPGWTGHPRHRIAVVAFSDRRQAGRLLGERLRGTRGDVVVMALPRGGVPVGFEVATALGCPLDVLIVRKLGVPHHPELGMGAIAEGGVRLLNRHLIAELGISEAAIDAVAARESVELERRLAAYRGGRAAEPVQGRTVVLVDDGIATGFTARASIEALRHMGANRIVVAVPVAPPDTVEELRAVADEVVCLETPAWFMAIGQWYANFRQVGDDEVEALLREAADRVERGRP